MYNQELADWLKVEWTEVLNDPVRDYFLARDTQPNLGEILNMFPRTNGDPAFDSEVIAGNIMAIKAVFWFGFMRQS